MKINLAMLAYNRPKTMKLVLDKLSKCIGIEKHKLFVGVEPGNDEVVAILSSYNSSDKNITVNRNHLGMRLNLYATIERAFADETDYIIYSHDDILSCWDTLVFHRWCAEKFKNDDSVLSTNTWPLSQCNLPLIHVDKYKYISKVHWWNAFLFGIWKNRWEKIQNDFLYDSGLHGNGFDYLFLKYEWVDKYYQVYPLLPRCIPIWSDKWTHQITKEEFNKYLIQTSSDDVKYSTDIDYITID